MKAAVMHAVATPLVIEDVDLDAPGPGEVLVEVVAAGLCHSDLRFIEGSFPHPLPTVLGHEVSGRVLAVGTEVGSVAPGDSVVGSLSVFCGECPYCVSGAPHLCSAKEATRRGPGDRPRITAGGRPVHQFLDLSAFAEQMLVHENALVRVDPEIDLETAALVGCGVSTGLGAVLNTANVARGETVAVVGCGGVGLSAVQGARIAGAGTIVAIDRVAEKLEKAVHLGATHVVDEASGDVAREVRAITDGMGVHHAIEAVGSTRTAELAFRLIRPGGTATIVGLTPTGSELAISTDALFSERKLQGSVMGSNDFKVDTPRYLQMHRDGLLDLEGMISNRIRLDEINEGFDLMESGRSIRTLVVFEGGAKPSQGPPPAVAP